MKLLAIIPFLAAADKCADPENKYGYKNKPGFCTEVTQWTTETNSWVCRNCFNLRVNFNLKWAGAVGHWWDNRDSIYFAFKKPVSVIKAAGPALKPVALDQQDEDGNYLYRMDFNNQAQFGDGRIDINVEFNPGEGNTFDFDNDLDWVRTCPCGVGSPEKPVVKDGCDPQAIDFPNPPAEGGFWKCGWHRRGPKQQRMNRCEWTCHGDDFEDDEDNWTTGAKVRCFREQGRQFRDGTRKFRELFTWKIGGNKNHQIEKISCDPAYRKN